MQAHLAALYALLARQGEVLVHAIMCALCDTCPRQLMRIASSTLRAMLSHPTLGSAAGTWFRYSLASGALPGMAEGRLTAQECAHAASIALGGTLRGARLVALLVDFGLLARGQATPDALLAYEL